MAGEADAARTKKSDRAYDVWVKSIAHGVVRTQEYLAAIQEERPTLIEVRIKCDPDDEEGVLVILKGYVGAINYVAFHRDETYSAAVAAVGNRLRNGSLKWRRDEGWQPAS